MSSQPTDGEDYPVPVPVDWSKEDFRIMIAAEGGDALAGVSPELRADRELVLAAVSQNGLSLRFAAESCCDDKEIVMQAVLQNGEALQFASLRLRSNEAVVQQALLGWALMDTMQWNQLAVYSTRWPVLRFASLALRDDLTFMMKEVSRLGFQLQFASEALRKDKQLVLTAVRSVGASFEFADETLKKDRAFVMSVVQLSGDAFEYCDCSFRLDREVAMTAFRHGSLPTILRCGHKSLLQDESFVMELQPYLTNCLFVRFSLLSGRSCFLLMSAGPPAPKWRMARHALFLLGMDASLLPCTELVRGDVPLPPFFDVVRELSNKAIVELTLIVSKG